MSATVCTILYYYAYAVMLVIVCMNAWHIDICMCITIASYISKTNYTGRQYTIIYIYIMGIYAQSEHINE